MRQRGKKNDDFGARSAPVVSSRRDQSSFSAGLSGGRSELGLSLPHRLAGESSSSRRPRERELRARALHDDGEEAQERRERQREMERRAQIEGEESAREERGE